MLIRARGLTAGGRTALRRRAPWGAPRAGSAGLDTGAPVAGRLRRALAARAAAWRTPAGARRAVAVAVVAALGLVMVCAAAPGAFVREPRGGYPGWAIGPFGPLSSWLPEEGVFPGAAFTLLMGAMFAAYVVVMACGERVPLRWGLGGVAALHGLLLLAPPLALTDVFNYLSFARLSIVHGVNPYLASPAEVPVDPAYTYTSWRHGLSPYGPLFTVASYAFAAPGVAVAHWGLKLLTALASLGCLALVWRIAERLKRPPLPAVLMVGLNPLVVVYGVGGVHNDFFMVGLILAGVLACVAGRAAAGGGALMGAVGIKLSGGLILPFALAAARGPERRRMAAGALAAGAGLAALSLAAFGPHPPAVGVQARFVTALSAPNLLGLAVGQGGATPVVRMAVQVVLLAVLAWLLVRTVRGADWLASAGWASLALVLSLAWEMPWYVMWVLPFAAVARSRALRRATLALSLFLLVALAPMSGYLLETVCRCSPSGTDTGKRNDAYILQFLR